MLIHPVRSAFDLYQVLFTFKVITLMTALASRKIPACLSCVAGIPIPQDPSFSVEFRMSPDISLHLRNKMLYHSFASKVLNLGDCQSTDSRKAVRNAECVALSTEQLLQTKE